MALEGECIERLGSLEGEQYRDEIRFYPGEKLRPRCCRMRGLVLANCLGGETGGELVSMHIISAVPTDNWAVVATGGFEPPT